MKNSRLVAMLLAVFCSMIPAAYTYAAQEGSWSLSEKGDYWMYYYSPNELATDTWIEDGGREYYLDSRGRMKTGWVTDSWTGDRHYLGEDGAKCYNIVTPDDHFVGADGKIMKSYDTYRKAIKQQLNKLMKSKEYKGKDVQQLPVFSVVDINGDTYRDLIVYDQAGESRRVLLAALWDAEEEKLQISAEADASETGTTSGLTYNRETEEVWLTIRDQNGWDSDYFLIGYSGPQFEHAWQFTMETNSWGDPDYYCNGERLAEDEWREAIIQADRESGEQLAAECFSLTEESIKKAVDIIPPAEELPLWES